MASQLLSKPPTAATLADGKSNPKKPSPNYLLVVHECWGLNDYIKKEAEVLWNSFSNIDVIALDLHDRKVAAAREDAAKYVQSLTLERAKAIIKGALSYARPVAHIYTIGCCSGSGWSLQASLLAGKQAAGCVMYYRMPEKKLDKLQSLQADVLDIFAYKNQCINAKIVDEFAVNRTKENKNRIIKRYEADQGFANPRNPNFDKQSKAKAWKTPWSSLRKGLNKR